MLNFVDTHTHLYLKEFDQDRDTVVVRAREQGVSHMLLPNVDARTIGPMMQLHEAYPAHCLPMMGLHPTSVKPGFEKTLQEMESWFEKKKIVAVGETGIDLYWDQTHKVLQQEAFVMHMEWALQYDLPLVIHSRNSVNEIKDALESYRGRGLRGVMHCFPGDEKQAGWFIDFGLLLGIGGVVTYKKSDMAKVVSHVGLEYVILETDAPYLPPVPFRGKRNEPAYLHYVANKIAEIKKIPVEDVAAITSSNAIQLFNL